MLKIFNFCTSTTSGIHTIMCSLETSMSSVDNDNDNDNVIIKLTSVDCSSVQLSHVSSVSYDKRANTLNAASFTSPTTYAVTHRHFTGCVCVCVMPSVLWRCWLGSRKGIRPVKNWVVGCWRGYLSRARCRLAHGPADATATHCLLLQ